MSVRHKAHLESLRSHFELMCLFSMLVISVDMAWVLRDAIVNGFDAFYIIIFMLLLIADIGIGYIAWSHHSKLVRKIRRTIMMDKLRYVRWLKHHEKEHNKTTGKRK